MATILALTLACVGYAQELKEDSSGGGAIVVDTVQATATVTAVDAAKRIVSVVNEAGVTNTYKLGKQVRNFDQIKVGDKVKATLVESVAVVIGKTGAPPQAGAGQVVALAP